MSELTLAQSKLQTDADYQTAIEQLLSDARRLSVLAQQDQDDIERLRAKSAPLRAEIRAMLINLGKPI